MQFKIVTISATGDPESEAELNRFLRGHRAVSVQRELVQHAGGAFWCFCIEYLLGGPSPDGDSRGRRRVDYKEVLSEEDFSVFAKLRDVRKQLAAEEAVPVYAVCTNEHLAEMARNRPKAVAELKKIEGFGDAKTQKYGEAFLAAIREMDGQTSEEGGEPD